MYNLLQVFSAHSQRIPNASCLSLSGYLDDPVHVILLITSTELTWWLAHRQVLLLPTASWLHLHLQKTKTSCILKFQPYSSSTHAVLLRRSRRALALRSRTLRVLPGRRKNFSESWTTACSNHRLGTAKTQNTCNVYIQQLCLYNSIICHR